jgi:glycosyltransferase involved in cell wall biosynthesis
MKFYCVTPCLNAEEYIEETMLSVLTQTVLEKPNFSLSYIIADGGSTDGTVSIIENIILKFSSKKNIQIRYFSKKDSGMYDALVNGFASEINTSDIYSYLNAGDYYSKSAFEIVSDIFAKNQYVHFITGINVSYNEKSHLTNFSLPFSYNKNLMMKGLYGKVLPFVQQESTFWDNKLHNKVNYDELRKLRLAGDYYLWKTFIKDYSLYIVSAWLGGFKTHRGQLSSRFIEKYHKETESISIKPTIFDYMIAYGHKVILYTPNKVKKKLSRHIFEYDNLSQEYRLTKKP